MFRIVWYIDEKLLRAYLSYFFLYEPVCKVFLDQRMWCVLPAVLDFHRITHCKRTPAFKTYIVCVYTCAYGSAIPTTLSLPDLYYRLLSNTAL